MPFDVGAVNINPPYVSCMLPLTLPSPAMVEAILVGRQPEGVPAGGGLQQTGWPIAVTSAAYRRRNDGRRQLSRALPSG
jgi:hypothetical protein